MNKNHICCFDFETGSADPSSCEILQIGAVMIHPKTLEIVSSFDSGVIRPDDIDAVEDGALRVNNIKREELYTGIDSQLAFTDFVNWINKYNFSKNNSVYQAPIPMGYNISGFDMPILTRYCKKYKIAWDDKRGKQKLFNQVHLFDVLHHMWAWTENNSSIEKLKLTSIMEWMGFPKERIESAHNALVDVQNTALIGIKLLTLSRVLQLKSTQQPINFEGSYAKWGL